jgi:iron complex transport system ATP-binding protein
MSATPIAMMRPASPSKLALEARGVRAGYRNRTVLEDLSVAIRAAEITALVGPNGSGKSTLLKTLARLLKPGGGSVLLDGKAISQMSTSAVARHMAVLPQGPSAPPGITVRELVEQGRFPHVGALRMLRQQDHAAITQALAVTGMIDYAARPLDSLSGGERQRAWIALTLAQDTPVLLLDEPTTFLDIGHQLEVLDLVETLNLQRGMTIVMVLHDLNQAARYAHRMLVLDKGAVVSDGPPATTLTADLLERVFNVRATIVSDPVTHAPVCVPHGNVRTNR